MPTHIGSEALLRGSAFCKASCPVHARSSIVEIKFASDYELHIICSHSLFSQPLRCGTSGAGSWNPTLTMVGLAQDLAQSLTMPKQVPDGEADVEMRPAPYLWRMSMDATTDGF